MQVLGYFDERFDKANCNQRCDNCKNTSEVVQEDVTQNAHDLIELARQTSGHRITRAMLLDIYAGRKSSANLSKGFDRYQSWGVGHDVPKERAERVFDHLYGLGILDLETEPSASGWSADYVKVRSINSYRL